MNMVEEIIIGISVWVTFGVGLLIGYVWGKQEAQ
jgi:hypothetical protein